MMIIFPAGVSKQLEVTSLFLTVSGFDFSVGFSGRNA